MANSSNIPTTPPRKSNQTLPPDTVPFTRHTSQSGYRTGDLNEGRRAVLSDLAKCLKIPFATLVSSAFGPEPAGSSKEFKQTKQKVRSMKSLFTPPSKSRLSEAQAFKPLGDMIKEIFRRSPHSPFSFDSSPCTTPLSTRQNTSRPDAYIERHGIKRKDVHWFDIAIPFEFKKTDNSTERLDNEGKMIWSLHNIMREDPLRRFVFGITVEDMNMRLWLSNRAYLAVSEAVDFIKNNDAAISLFLLLGSCDDVGLGWDPTVERERNPDSGEITYVFTICGKRFTTIRPLATYGADSMVGRGTRVFLARDEDGREVAIKDSWRDSDRDSEGTILEKIFGDIRDKLGEEAAEAEKYFVAVDCYEDVSFAPGKLDQTLALQCGYTPKWDRITADPPLSAKVHTSSIGDIPELAATQLIMRRLPRDSPTIPCRTHARTVFRDVGVPLQAVSSLTKSFMCLNYALRGLYYLHRAGWVHRDFGVGNVLWVEGDENRCMGKLGDLEYAKRVDSGVSHEVRTGTMHFMAIEVEQQRYLFTPDLDYRKASEEPPPPFRMNYIHDLESHWWAAMWILFFHTDKNSPPGNIDDQLRTFEEAFPSVIGTSSRQNFFRDTYIHGEAYKLLSTTCQCKAGCGSIFDLAKTLRQFYQQAEISFPTVKLDENLVVEMHRKVQAAYAETVDWLQKSKDITLQPLHKVSGQKRVLDGSLTKEAERKPRWT
ncbi:hypothetical protein JVU11DRAFT_11379 [Chiua virens]|nr:hypothetical protein JVU11DRAFT_11379 [Chiua virens]